MPGEPRTEAGMTADDEATMRDFAALPDFERVTMTARDARQIIATIDRLRAEAAALDLDLLARIIDDYDDLVSAGLTKISQDEWQRHRYQALNWADARLATPAPEGEPK